MTSSFSSSSSDDDIEAGFSGCGPHLALRPPEPAPEHRRRPGGLAGALAGAPRFFCDGFDYDEPRHFLDNCFLCRRSLAGGRDIFMYKGDTPFCSEDCRQEQIEIDEAEERKLGLSIKRTKEQSKSGAGAGASPESEKIRVRAPGTVVAG